MAFLPLPFRLLLLLLLPLLLFLLLAPPLRHSSRPPSKTVQSALHLSIRGTPLPSSSLPLPSFALNTSPSGTFHLTFSPFPPAITINQNRSQYLILVEWCSARAAKGWGGEEGGERVGWLADERGVAAALARSAARGDRHAEVQAGG